MQTDNKIANFWIRFLSGIIDLITIFIFIIAISFAVFTTDNVKEELITWKYYLWYFLVIVLIFLLKIIIPIFNHNQSIGQKLCKIKVVFLEPPITFKQKIISQIKKEAFTSLNWIVLFLISACCLIPQVAEKLIKSNNSNVQIKLTDSDYWNWWEQFLISIPILFSNINTLISFVLIISIARKSKVGLNDLYSKSRTVWKYKKEKKEDQIIYKIEPEKIIFKKLIWMESEKNEIR
ncbi:RDD family protein [Mycoplasma sp. 1654_15]|uniref:RDD family protein n=1 Tax=Mycoplasma sp. 1654_15 TaxID=2725994 RepID=UPI00144964B0|nr:RDD family protein [Mycoplasma sp. 1654_15]QJB71332.1 hypothetical protein HF996_02475 [Mycoplasma sp. 1654_15]